MSRVFSRKTRWLALVAGLIGATASSFIFGPQGGLMFALAQILGAVSQAHLPRIGRALMLMGALILSVLVIPVGSAMVLECLDTRSRYHDFGLLGIPLLWTAALVVQVWCDVLLVMESMRMHRAQRLAVRSER